MNPRPPGSAWLPRTAIRQLETLGRDCPPGGRGWCTAAACLIEATTAKPGNVHPTASFDDLTYDDLVTAGLAIAPVMQRAADVPLGVTIEAAVGASRRVTRSNANLGIVLAIAPLAAVRHEGAPTERGVASVLANLGSDDAAAVWRAIATARPGGLGHAERFDLHDPPPSDLLAAMRAAAGHDAIARLWSENFAPLFAGPVRDLSAALDAGAAKDDAVLDTFLAQLAREPDSLIARRHGPDVAAAVSARAARVRAAPAPERPRALAAFDHDLRVPRRVNPGTTADLVAAAIYTLMRRLFGPLGR